MAFDKVSVNIITAGEAIEITESQSVKSDVKELSFEQFLQARGVSRPYVRVRVRARLRSCPDS